MPREHVERHEKPFKVSRLEFDLLGYCLNITRMDSLLKSFAQTGGRLGLL